MAGGCGFAAAALELIGPIELPDAFLHHGGMAILVHAETAQVTEVEFFLLFPEAFFGAFDAGVNGGECFPLFLHVLRGADPSIVIDIGVDAGDLELVSPLFLAVMDAVEFGNAAERLCGLPGMDILVVANDPDLVGVPGVGRDMMVVVSPEVAVFEQDPFDGGIVEQLFAALFDAGEVFFVYYFVGLDVKKPVAFAGIFGDIGLVGVFHATGELVEVPDGVNDPDLVGADAFNFFEGSIVGVAVAYGYDEFVADG